VVYLASRISSGERQKQKVNSEEDVEEEEDVADKSYGRPNYNVVEYMLPSFLISIFLAIKMEDYSMFFTCPAKKKVNIT
jgi:hypothetical protein